MGAVGSSPPEDWRTGSERTAMLEGERFVIDGDALTLERAKTSKA